MSIPVNLFFKGNRRYGVGQITFDLILSEQHEMNADVTEHSVEDGSTISDHIENQLETGSLTGLITNYTIFLPLLITNRAQDNFDAFVSLHEERTLVEITTVLKVYEDMAITNISISRDEETGESLQANISFKKVKTVKLQEVEVEVSVKVDDLNSNQNRQVSSQTDAGRQSTTQSATSITP